MSPKLAAAVLGVIALVAAGVFVWPGTGGDDDDNDDGEATLVLSQVERRDLTEVITVRGEIRRDELQRITSGIEGRVSSVLVQDGDTVDAGDVVFALDGRAAVAVNGEFAFFRPLDVGSDGPDVAQLERILADAGYQVGLVDQLFTEETRAGLRRWQVDRGYGGATPEPEENIVVTISGNSAGYQIGPRNTISIELAPSVPPQSSRATADAEPDAADDEESLGGPALGNGPTFLRLPAQDDPTPTPDPTATPAPTATPSPAKPVIEVRVSPRTVEEGETAVFTFTSDIPMPSDTVVDFATGGDATAGDDYDDDRLDDGSFVFPAGDTTFELVVPTLVDDEIETDEELTVEVGTGIITNDTDAYVPGPLREARLTITSPPGAKQVLTVESDTVSVSEGGTITFQIETDLVRNEATTVAFTLGGTASGTDYDIDSFEVDLGAGSESVAVTVATRDDSFVEADESVVFSLAPAPDGDYIIGSPASTSAVIESDDLPEMSIEGGGRVGEGGALGFVIRADQAVIEDTSINYSVGGSATPGQDYKELAGTALMRAGQSHVHVDIQTIDDDVVFQPGDMIVADWPARVGTVSVDEGEFILLGQEVLTLTEPTFTITLALSPTDRGRLRTGMSVMVELQASDDPAVPGFIAQLDDTATIDDAGEETYEGVVDTVQPLEAVDGARVNVDVTLQERLNAITVPVAAVLQDGAGNDVVRVVTTDRRTRQVQVEVGLTEGAFVEIRSGLEGDELVVVET